MKRINLLIVLILVIGFNNCGSHHLRDVQQTINVSSIFPFNKKSQYYQNVQIVEKTETDGVWNYQFIASIVDADQEEKNIDVELDILDVKGKRVCPRTLATVNRMNNHIQILSCESQTNHGALKIEIKVGPEGQSRSLIATQDFDLSNL